MSTRARGFLWVWRHDADAGRWLSVSWLGVLLWLMLLPFSALLLMIAWPWKLLGVLACIPWDRVSVSVDGVLLVRGFGPIVWTWRRFPPGGHVHVYDGFDSHEKETGFEYWIDGREHALSDCFAAERVCDLLNATASRAWRDVT